MADCCDCFEFRDESDSFESWQGLRGPYYTPYVAPDGTLTWTNNGGLPNPASVDISGPPGPGVELRGPVASVADLPATAPSGELWLVGAASPYDGWFYNGGSWEDLGQIAIGPVGPTGATPDLQIGTVETGAPGSAAEASITGTPEEPLLNLKLPRGQQGPAVPLSDATPLMDGAATPGAGTSAARSDHRHPTDTSRVAKTGDTMTGPLKVGGPNGASSDGLLQIQGGDKTVPPSSGFSYAASLRLADAFDRAFGLLRSFQDPNGQIGVFLYGLRADSNALNGLRLLFNGNSPVVELTAPDAWRSALSLGAAALDNIVPVSHGGTGQTGTSAAITTPASIATAATGFSISSASFANWGKIAMLNITFNATADHSGTTQLGTLVGASSGVISKRPALFFNCIDSVNDIILIQADGKIFSFKTISNGSSVTIRCVYLLA